MELMLTPFELHQAGSRELDWPIYSKMIIHTFLIGSSGENAKDTDKREWPKTKAEEKAAEKQPEKKTSISEYFFKICLKELHQKLNFQKKSSHSKWNRIHRNFRRRKIESPKLYFLTDCISEWEEERTAPQIGDQVRPKNRHWVGGLDRMYIQRENP